MSPYYQQIAAGYTRDPFTGETVQDLIDLLKTLPPSSRVVRQTTAEYGITEIEGVWSNVKTGVVIID